MQEIGQEIGQESFEAAASTVHARDGVVTIAFSGAEGAERRLDVVLPAEAARLLYSQLTVALNAHQHLIPG